MSHLQHRQSHRGGAAAGVLIGTALAGLAVAGAAWMLSGVDSAGDGFAASDLYMVERGGFEVTVPASGNLIAQEQVEIRNTLDGNAVIAEIVPEGTAVNTGDVLLRLDDEAVKERITTAEEELVKAEAAVEADQAALEIATKSRESSMSAAAVAVDQANLALLAWREGEVVAQRNALELAVRTATKDYDRLMDKYEKSLELRSREFISQNDLEQDEIAMIRAEAALSKARLDKEVYESYTFQKEQQAKESAWQQAKEEQVRVDKRTAAQVRTAETKFEATQAALLSKQERLTRYEAQLEATTVLAPASGMVVYGSTIQRDRRRENESALRVGSGVYRNQLLIVLPDTTRMAADVKVNEALSGLIESGQTAVIRTDALPDVVFEGVVHSVGVLAEDGGWRDPNRRDYSVRIDLDDIGDHPLKPSMRCTARVLVDRVDDVLFIPVHAVHRRGRTTFVHVGRDGLFDERQVTLGRASDRWVEIVEGLEPDESVLLRDPPPGTLGRSLDDATPA
ncbi:MAG: HlyD family efflux transporter periplasmic adaptor subunit [Phycisphaerales bacterium]|nr:HlyD family efflux transporter periplasmic adaptor subunit [Phycisphaerales bacterium]